VFPARRGKRAGEAKAKSSHAKAFRRDLERAFGVYAWKWDEPAKGKTEPETGSYVEAREHTARERQLFTETPHTMPVDFHSWRRAYSQALADADVNVQQAAGRAGHASLTAHQRYLENASKMRRLPEKALPRLDVRPTIGHGQCPISAPEGGAANENSIKHAARAGSSAVERWPYKPDVAGSKPVPPTERRHRGCETLARP
jgi:hypothetical protein